MPNLSDIVEVAEALESKAVFVAEDRCVVVRNRNAKCRKCQAACPTDAFTIEGNTLLLDSSACVACGACTVVCPTEALIPLRPFDEDLATDIADACINKEGTAVFACARIASKRLADSETFAEVPCLARMEESILVELAAQEVERILLIDGVCSTCKFRFCNKGIDETVGSANTLLHAMGSPLQVERLSAFPPEMLVKEQAGHYGVSRRAFFSKTRGTAKDAAGKAVTTMLRSNQQKKEPTLRERLKMSDAGTLPQFEAKRRINILDAMDRIGQPQVEEMETRLWGKVVIDTEICNSCDMCATFCPTGALRKAEPGESEEKINALEFTMMDCVQCRTCEDICLKKCLKVETVVQLEQLFDFEPKTILLPDPPKRGMILGSSKR